MLKKDFWFDLPQELIAQEPADPRDSAACCVPSEAAMNFGTRFFPICLTY